MTDQKPYLYTVTNMFGCVLGVTDYGFSCVVFAESEEDAHSWGLRVATEYAARFGFHPHKLKPDEAQIKSNSYVWEYDGDPSRADCVCHYGSYPVDLQ